MDERRDPQTSAPDEGELLAAYLSAETDELTTARIERRLLEDPGLAARLDALARTRARLQRLDDVTPPPGFRERLDARLRAERAAVTPPASGTAAPSPRHQTAGGTASPPVAPARRARWLQPLAAAAALVFAVAVGGVALRDVLSQAGRGESTASTANLQEAEDGQAAAPPAPMAVPDSAERDAAGGGAAADAGEGPIAPLAGEESAVPQVRSDADISARLRDLPTTDDPLRSERELRAGAGLPTEDLCLAGVDTSTVDLVERDGTPLLTALTADGRTVMVFDPATCRQVDTYAP